MPSLELILLHAGITVFAVNKTLVYIFLQRTTWQWLWRSSFDEW